MQDVLVLHADGCRQDLVVVEERLTGGLRDGAEGGTVTWRGIHWWPTPGATKASDASVPTNVAASHAEGVRCLSADAPHGAVALLRTPLAYIVQDRGSAAAQAKKTLNDAIKQMVAESTLSDAFTDWATHIRERQRRCAPGHLR
ncbi:MAG TPA: hypothetical protein VI357_10155 [Mycobacteriales bacterium]